MTTTALFSADELADYLHQSVDADIAALAERVAWGWLSDVTGLTVRPDPVTADLFAWALELGAMAYDNPTSLETRQVDDVVMRTTEDRRQAILRAAGDAPDVSTTTSGARGWFPDAQGWPDPICIRPTVWLS